MITTLTFSDVIAYDDDPSESAPRSGRLRQFNPPEHLRRLNKPHQYWGTDPKVANNYSQGMKRGAWPEAGRRPWPFAVFSAKQIFRHDWQAGSLRTQHGRLFAKT